MSISRVGSGVLCRSMNPNAADRYGRTALHVAAIRGDKKIKTVQKLLDAGASIDIKDPRGATALHYAAANNARKIVALMISQREPTPNVNAADIDGQTALHLAAAQNLLDVVKLLVGVDDSVPKWCPKVDHTIRDRRGQTALDYALKRQASAEQLGERAIVQLLKLLPAQRVPPHSTPATESLPTRHSASPAAERAERGHAAVAHHSARLARAKQDRLECPVGKPITARWGVPSNRVDPWLERWLRTTRGVNRIGGGERSNGPEDQPLAGANGVQHARPWATLSFPCAADHRGR